MSRLISGHYVSTLANRFFSVIKLPLQVLLLSIRVLNKVLDRFVFSKIDVALSRTARKRLAKKTPVDPNIILFITFQSEYTCNAKYISEEMIRRGSTYNIVWAVSPSSQGPHPSEMSFVRIGSEDFYKTAARAKVIVQNGHTLQLQTVAKNTGQYWIQTWHGSLGLKRLEGARGDDRFYDEMRALQSRQTDFLISNSQFEDDAFDKTYWPGIPVLKLGHARNDILFDRSAETAGDLRRKVLTRLNVTDTGQNFLLFAPTHDEKSFGRSFGNLDFERLREVLRSKFGGTWEFLIRAHESNKRSSKQWFAGLPIYCHNVSFYPDMQELMMVASIGVTDYSSWVCDYILTGKPSFLYGVNLRNFDAVRGFHHEVEDTPFSMATSNAELVQNISAFDQHEYESKIEQFLEHCGSVDDGRAAPRIVDKLEELMEH
ncbi:CDP-glycerol glycerophosphotransferase family protein [Salinibacterium sp. NK8237]|uniref:CDP-glycerol glycerophosphotransferase family protein n=1 Tax=Salinibacterium sp. NK8237 TaxID=2792038 RepID=UPI0018CCD81F|nr:CDP-glycerol glycerophosphotransferase family protein [Salinibacterium sp. NK8237]MBH0129652.1 CDP-glycerol glycerophosphotransferase family protein [Salinibacterium sp. NK8237]